MIPDHDSRLIIGLGSRARVGKDYAVSVLQKEFGTKNVFRIGFADALKSDLFTLLRDKASINVFHTTPEDKELIRPVLVAYGEMMRNIRADYWVERVFEIIARRSEPIVVVTDCRYENEVEILQKRGGIYIEIETDVPPSNASEAKHSPKCRAMADRIVTNKFDEQFAVDLIKTVKEL